MRLESKAINPPAPSFQTRSVPGFVLRLGTHPAGSSLPRHAHEDPTICYVLRGRFTEYSAGEAAECDAHTLKVMPAGEPHSNSFGEVETRGLRIDVDRARFAEVPAVFRALDERRRTSGGRVAALAHRLVREFHVADAAAPLAVEALALELVVELARADAPGTGATRTTPAWLAQAEEVVRDRYRTRVSVGAVARIVEVHPATLSRAWRRRFGCTIGEHVRRLRVDHAARELLTTRAPISEIALRAGFYDQSHFTSVFRRMLGVTPAAYRASA